jgi:DNA-binding winged helix-turn-helix (wHTH) protein/Flp pilus assembly protein TadD
MGVTELERPQPQAVVPGWRFGPYRLEDGLLRRDGAPVDLTPKELGVLGVLIEARGGVVTADSLLDRVWRNAPVGTSSLHRCVSTLRARLAEGIPGRAAIETLHRRGYRFALSAQPVRPEAERGAAERAGGLVQQALEFVGHRTPTHMTLAERALREALVLDPGCLAAARLLAHLHASEAMRGYRVPRAAGTLAREAARAVLAQAPDDAEALAVDGWVRVTIEGDAEGLAALDEAQARAPENRMVLFYRGWALAARGRPLAGATSVGEALALQPLAPGIAAALGYLRFCAGDSVRALEGLRRAAEDMPVNHIIFAALSLIAAWRGEHAEALAAAERACKLSDRVGLDLICLGYALAQAGRPADAARVLAEFEAAGQPAPPTQVAALHVALGNLDTARQMLARAAADGCPYRLLARHDPRFAALDLQHIRLG